MRLYILFGLNTELFVFIKCTNSPLLQTLLFTIGTKCCLRVVNNERQISWMHVEMIVEKAEDDSGMKGSQGYLSFGAFVCSCFQISKRGHDRWQQKLPLLLLIHPSHLLG